MHSVNYKSDFTLFLRFYDTQGDVLNLAEMPEVDFKLLVYTTNRLFGYTAERIGGIVSNCELDGEVIVLHLDNHKLSTGRLRTELTLNWPNEDYSDGGRKDVIPYDLDIQLVNDVSCQGNHVEATVRLPFASVENKKELAKFKEETSLQFSYVNRAIYDYQSVHNSLDKRISATEKELVGIWDEIGEIREFIMAAHSGEVDELLRQLDYTDEDIQEYKDAIIKHGVNITMDELRESAQTWCGIKEEIAKAGHVHSDTISGHENYDKFLDIVVMPTFNNLAYFKLFYCIQGTYEVVCSVSKFPRIGQRKVKYLPALRYDNGVTSAGITYEYYSSTKTATLTPSFWNTDRLSNNPIQYIGGVRGRVVDGALECPTLPRTDVLIKGLPHLKGLGRLEFDIPTSTVCVLNCPQLRYFGGVQVWDEVANKPINTGFYFDGCSISDISEVFLNSSSGVVRMAFALKNNLVPITGNAGHSIGFGDCAFPGCSFNNTRLYNWDADGDGTHFIEGYNKVFSTRGAAGGYTLYNATSEVVSNNTWFYGWRGAMDGNGRIGVWDIHLGSKSTLHKPISVSTSMESFAPVEIGSGSSGEVDLTHNSDAAIKRIAQCGGKYWSNASVTFYITSAQADTLKDVISTHSSQGYTFVIVDDGTPQIAPFSARIDEPETVIEQWNNQ